MKSTLISQYFFQLIQVSLDSNRRLSSIPTTKDWERLFVLAQKQALLGVCFYGIQKLSKEQTVNLPVSLKMQWLGIAAKIQQRNEYMNKRCVELQANLVAAGFRNSILKGQGVATLYTSSDLDLLRQPGDIDVFVDASREEVIRYAQSLGDCYPDWDYKHLHLKVYNDVEVEVHYVPEVFLNLWKNRKLQRWFVEHKEDIFDSVKIHSNESTEDMSLVSPSIDFNVFYVLLHIYRHFLYEGVGLRQLLDYYFVLKTYSVDLRTTGIQICDTIKSFGMERFTQGLMWVLQYVFNLDDKYFICEADEKEGKYILNQIMQGGNFGHHDERLKCSGRGKYAAVSKILKHNYHLLSHYTLDVIWAPVWVIWHWMWKRMKQ